MSASPSASSFELVPPPALASWLDVPDALSVWPAQRRAELAARAPDLPAGRAFAARLAALVAPEQPAYPPEALALLAGALAASGAGARSHALVYYLLLDIAAAAAAPQPEYGAAQLAPSERTELRGRAAAFARRTGLPRKFREAVQGYWYVDHGMYKDALPYLAQADFRPALLRAFSPLSPLAPPPAERAALLLALRRLTATPPPQQLAAEPGSELAAEEEHAVESDVLAVAHVHGLAAAWRRASELGLGAPTDAELALMARCKARLLSFCFEPEAQTTAVAALVALPLTDADETFLHDFVTASPPALAPGAAAAALDVLLVRYINAGSYLAAVRLADAAPLPEYAADAARARQLREARRRMIEGARAVLPEVQRALLDINLEAAASPESAAGGDLAMSWEQVDAQPARAAPEPLSASVALRKPPGALESPRAASHAADPLGALLHAVVRASPTSNGSPRRLQSRASLTGRLSPASPAPRGAVPAGASASPAALPGFLARQRPDGDATEPASAELASDLGGAAPKRPYAASFAAGISGSPRSASPAASRPAPVSTTPQKPTALMSQSPFAGPPRLLPSSATAGYASSSPFARQVASASQSSAPPANAASTPTPLGQNSAFAPAPRRYEARYEAGRAQGSPSQEASGAANADTEMLEGDTGVPSPAVTRRQGRARQAAPAKRTEQIKEQESEAGHESVPGGFPEAQDATMAEAETPSKPRAPTRRTREPSAPPATKQPMKRNTRSRTADLGSEAGSDGESAPQRTMSRPVSTRAIASSSRTQRATRSQSVLSVSNAEAEQDAGDTVGELLETPVRRTRGGAGKPAAVRRSARLSVEPEEAAASTMAPSVSMRSLRARGTTPAADTPGKTRTPARRRATSTKAKADTSMAEAAEENEEELEAGIRTRSGKSTMPGGM